jgi:hypothetical protein
MLWRRGNRQVELATFDGLVCPSHQTGVTVRLDRVELLQKLGMSSANRAGKALWGRTATTEVAKSLTPARVETQTRCSYDEYAQCRL